MNSKDLTREQLDTLGKQIGPALRYLLALQRRMERTGFTVDDELFRLTQQAYEGRIIFRWRCTIWSAMRGSGVERWADPTASRLRHRTSPLSRSAVHPDEPFRARLPLPPRVTMGRMGESAEQPSKRLGYAILWSLVILLAIPPCYLLSIGPVWGMAKRGWISQTVADTYVYPVREAGLRNPRSLFSSMIDRYVQLWCR